METNETKTTSEEIKSLYLLLNKENRAKALDMLCTLLRKEGKEEDADEITRLSPYLLEIGMKQEKNTGAEKS